jgi:hypothetical protein
LNQRCNVKNIKKVLFLSAEPWTEYLRCTLLHGFKLLFGSDCHDFPKIRHLYKNEDLDYANYCYGRGYSHSNLLEQSYRNDNYDETIEEDIKNKKYDIIIWADSHRWFLDKSVYSRPYFEHYDLANKYYDNNRLILIDGWDEQNVMIDMYMSFINKGNIVFVREFPDL